MQNINLQNFQHDQLRQKDSVFNDGSTLWKHKLEDEEMPLDQQKFKICCEKKCKTKLLTLFPKYIRYSRQKIIHFENSIFDLIYNSQNQLAGFRLQKYDSFVEILGESKLWIKRMKKQVIQSDFTRNYTLTKKIGKGTQATVYIAKHKKSNKEYAAKMFNKKHIILEDQEIQMINKEVEILRLFQHPNLCQLYEVFECNKHLTLIMDLFNGEELVYSLKIGGLSEVQSILIIKPLFQVVNQLHEKGIFHRDIKPQNIVMQQFGKLETASLIDLGLADYWNEKGNYLFTQCGTPGYVAPEILSGYSYDLKVDVYSLGLVLYLILTGKEPFQSNDLDQLIELNSQGHVYFQSLNVSPNCFDFLRRTLEKNPKLRMTSTDALEHPFLIFGPGNHLDMMQQQQNQNIQSSKSLRFRKSIASLRLQTERSLDQTHKQQTQTIKITQKKFSIRKVQI